MRVLFLTHPEADYGEALLYRGLCTVLGDDNVWDHPVKPTYRGTEVWNWHGTYFDGSGTVSRHPWFKPVTSTERSRDEVLAGDFDLVVLGSLRAEPLAAWRLLAARRAMPPTVVLEGEDHDRIEADKAQGVRAAVYFKRDCVYEEHQWGVSGLRIRPLPFSCGWVDLESPGDPMRDSRGGLYFSAGLTTPERRVVMDLLREYHVGVYKDSPGDYGNALCTARIGLSVRGNGYDTLRHWEVPFFGAALLTDSQVKVSDDFQPNECIRYDSYEVLPDLVKSLLKDPARLCEIAVAGQKRLLASHTPAARARYLLGCARESA